ncbi:hypothetical protein Herbaro_19060 [Herbaspirillum sp. WKF16]|uniref:hypothetical protein n=1 Tax=Herbaspirillum sp. WKF16 TaxID=3028312 RepID=UPI0023A91D15|nr:hypothetical protein [Herbaspirillum sp. WKF16]WDZ95558.1 hypothetical protein Herbaro_19060 [Herbaspirillum sp. WKF16]
MRAPLAIVAAFLAPLAGVFAAAAAAVAVAATAAAPTDESALARAWIAQARRAARPGPQLDRTPQAGAPATADDEDVAATLSDPFALRGGLEPASQSTPQKGRIAGDEEEEIEAPATRIRLLGTLVQDSMACAVLQIDGASYRVRPGDPLPDRLGKVLRIDEASLDFAGPDTAQTVHTIRLAAPSKAGA